MMYEKETKYRPLVCMDTDGIEHTAMFMALNEKSVKEHHRLYLKESVPHVYRLCSSVSITAEECDRLRIRCPQCGRVMKAVSPQKSGLLHAAYACPHCV